MHVWAIKMHLFIAQPNKHSCLAYFSNSFFDVSLEVREKKFLPCHAHSLILRPLCIYWFLILCNFGQDYYETVFAKGQLISKADWRAIDSPKKRRDEFVLFAFLLFTANKSNSSVRFFG